MIDLLENYGFDLWHLETVTKDPTNHKLLQLDGIFLRKDDNIQEIFNYNFRKEFNISI